MVLPVIAFQMKFIHYGVLPLLFFSPLCWTDDFDDFCILASKLADESNGAPLFTVAHSRILPKRVGHNDTSNDSIGDQVDDSLGMMPVSEAEGYAQEDDWQFL